MALFKWTKEDRRGNKINSVIENDNIYESTFLIPPQKIDIKQVLKVTSSKRKKSLKLNYAQLEEIPEEIRGFDFLNILDLSNNSIEKIPDWIGTLKNLKVLVLKNNQLEELPNNICNLTKLSKLIIGGNFLSELPNDFRKLQNIKEIYLGSNKFEKFPISILELPNLKSLWLNRNELTIVPNEIDKLEKLQKLFLARNFIKKIPENVNKLINLKTLNLENNRLQTFPESILSNNELEEVFLNRNPMEDIPIYEWEGNSLSKLKIYFNRISISSKKDFRAKIVMLGKGDVGKTTLMERLIKKDISKNELKRIKQTHGINIKPLNNISFKEEDEEYTFELNMWDFGGQEIQWNIHHLFLTQNALYLLVWSVRNSEKKYAYFRQWLNLIETYTGITSRVILILNKAFGTDGIKEEIDRESLQKEFPILKSFSEISAFYNINVWGEKSLRTQITNQLKQLKDVGKVLPSKWTDIKIILSEYTQKTITKSDFINQICAKHEIFEKEEQRMILNWLHRIGAILYYEKPGELRNTIILQPEWIANSVYKILLDNNKTISSNAGVFDYDYIENLLGADYEEDIIIDLMTKFELCFKVGEDSYIAPHLLPPSKPSKINWNSKDNFFYEYHYKLMPTITISRFIAKAYIDNLVEGSFYWQNGVVLKKNNTRAIVEYDFANKSNYDIIKIRIEGTEVSRLLNTIRDKFDEINMSGKVEGFYVRCTNRSLCKNSDNTHYNLFNIETLEDMKSKGISNVQCMKCYIEVPIIKLLSDFSISEKKSNIEINLNQETGNNGTNKMELNTNGEN